MTSQRVKRLEEAGIDVVAALERMMGSEELLERLLRKFLENQQYPALCAALKGGDTEQAMITAHTLKGVCGNLSMVSLYGLFARQVDALRAGELSLAQHLMEQITPAYVQVTAAIREHPDGGA